MTLAALYALISAWLPTIAAGAGPVAAIAGLAAKFMPNARTWLVLGAIIAGVVAVGGAVVHYMNLRKAAADLGVLEPKIAGLERSLGCPTRVPEERDLFACIPARDRDIDREIAAQLKAQRDANTAAQADLLAKTEQLQRDLDSEQDAIQDAAEDGPLPKVLTDAWARARLKAGKK